ncbi:MAG: hypothetical protein IPI33_09065 [Dehalococcoidia bacterium]|uniref:hypothetical protein n=1 Tax=Candidatus Amarobacter glycogenicus TaxID=3140699 RepID=UPI001DBA16DB|nr:hypothetical protein [Dehalococcoidia bacterium]MBK7126728.1 hypothetical protein [Dehalococcoidia bacterium]MBK7329662.1 hypothetical protein [Dehalococcoidia bacterium]MBK7725367.1 hypothetical protein [Dehalococcoidia bacterium]MBK8561571.1 hypothetical protein [Dehalococcoidia bacterium]
MLTEYIASILLAERRAEILQLQLAAEAERLNGRQGWLSRLTRRPDSTQARRARSAASAAGHSLSMME